MVRSRQRVFARIIINLAGGFFVGTAFIVYTVMVFRTITTLQWHAIAINCGANVTRAFGDIQYDYSVDTCIVHAHVQAFALTFVSRCISVRISIAAFVKERLTMSSIGVVVKA